MRPKKRILSIRASQSSNEDRSKAAADTTTTDSSIRLFSNLNPSTMKHEPGSVWGAAALVSGTAVGAGILALPAVTHDAGFVASSVALSGCAIFSILTGLLVAEVTVNTLCELGGQRGVSIGSMARRTLGDTGATLVSICYALLHYSLLVAYISKAGSTLTDSVGIPTLPADIGFTALIGGLCYFARPNVLDSINSALVVAVLATFGGLLFTVGAGSDVSLLARTDWDAVPAALPVIALAFVYQNVVPVIASSLEGDLTKIRQAIIIGVLVPWAMFIAWDAAILGSPSAAEVVSGADPLIALRAEGPLVSSLVDGFSLLAIITSFIGFVLGLSEFVAEQLQLPIGSQKTIPYALTLIPPLILALLFPDLFFQALDFAGTYGVLVLFGLIPVAMTWSERYGDSTLTRIEVAPGGKPVLIGVAALAGGVIVDQLLGR